MQKEMETYAQHKKERCNKNLDLYNQLEKVKSELREFGHEEGFDCQDENDNKFRRFSFETVSDNSLQITITN